MYQMKYRSIWMVWCCALLWASTGAWAADVAILPSEGEPAPVELDAVWEDASAYRQPDGSFRLGVYNIQDFAAGGPDQGRPLEVLQRHAKAAAAVMDAIDADIWVLQEIENGAALAALNEAQAEPYAAGYVTAFGDGASRAFRLNLAVLSRIELDDVTEIDFTGLSGRGRPTRGLLRMEVELADDANVLVYNVHLKSNWGNQQRNISQRANALSLLVADANAQRAADDELIGTIVAGDFNVDPEHASFAGDTSLVPLADFVDLWQGRPLAERVTVPTRYGDPELEFPAVCFDRIYVSPELARGVWTVGTPQVLPAGVHIEDVRVVAGQDDTTASDHYPVFVDFYHSAP
jgi:endonuclease/exonuclease/phosphatase family metal-dependent hydrolase